MNRREALTTLSAVALSPALALAAAPPAKAAPAAAAALDTKALAAAARGCIEAGDECVEHCITMLSNGDKSMSDCFAAVRAMLPTCHGLEQLAKLNNANLKAYAAVCAKVCRDCEKACKVHADKHPPCKACMDACAKCATECEKAAA
ncbi:MAG: Csp1 family four helix bundle copper storage protein [Archangiaceae bacterium]|nr:Csp1 family four helix bundle copper storage protein [Archangiaceae bacterium]